MLAFNNRILSLFKRPVLVLLIPLVCFVFYSYKIEQSALAEDSSVTAKNVSISAASFEVSSADGLGFSNGGAAITADLANDASFNGFDQNNSAYLSVGDLSRLASSPDTTTVTPVLPPTTPSAVEASPEATSEAPQAPINDSPATETPPAVEPSVNTATDVTPIQTGAEVNPAPQPTLPIDATTPASSPDATDSKSEPAAAQLVEHALILKDFSLNGAMGGAITNAQLRLSLAGRQIGARDQIKLAFKTGADWQEAGTLDFKNELSNSDNKGYYLFALPVFASWDDLKNLEVRLSFVGDSEASAAEVYVDGAWLELDYQATGDGESLSALSEATTTDQPVLNEATQPADYEVNLISPDTAFKTSDNPDFNFRYKRKQGKLQELLTGLLGLVSDQYSGLNIKTKISNDQGRDLPIDSTVDYLSNGEFHIRVTNRPRTFRPGRYTMNIEINDGGNIKTQTQDFSWGVLAINTNKSVYLPTEKAYLQMGVLDDNGDTICHADLFLEITAPDGGVAYLDTYNGLIERNPDCAPNNVITTPDYFAHYGLAGSGVYKVKLTAHTANGNRTIYDQFEVRDELPFDIERIGPTRIWPWADYDMTIRIKASSSARDFYEVIPKNFVIKSSVLKLNDQVLTADTDYNFENYPDNNEGMVLHWSNLNLNNSDTLEVNYSFDAPNVSPEFYLLGPAKIDEYSESRAWQIASDATSTSIDANAGFAVGVVWGTAANAWNSVNNNYATHAVAGNTNETNIYLRTTGSTATNLGYKILKVEIGTEAFSNGANLMAVLRPLFGGTATGTAQAYTLALADPNTTTWFDITNDAAGPGSAAAWTWGDVINLDVLVNGSTTSATGRTLSVDQIRIRVTYDIPPVNVINSVVSKKDGSGLVDFAVAVSDVDKDNNALKVEYVPNASCVFSSPNDPTIATTGTSSTFGTFSVDNTQAYQIGSTTATSSAIYTASGTNTINFDWNSQADVPNADGVYCVRVTANDGYVDATSTTATTTLDNVHPTTPGDFTASTTWVGNQVQIDFGSSSSDTHFKEYKIFYKVGVTDATESDTPFTQVTDPNLAVADLNGATSTLVSDLAARTTYTFVLYAYDTFGNKASTSQVTVTTGKAVPPRANTVQFFGGQWSANGTTGSSTDADLTLPPFDFALAETGASIESAYIMFEANYNSYINYSTTTGYKLAFDTCQEPCTANAFSGVGNVLKYDNTVLSYKSTAVNVGGNMVRLLLDVTDEAQLAAYRGAGTQMQGQVGYRFELGTTTVTNSISAVKAVMFVTYKYYDANTSSYTNTVVYPLESTNGGTDTGSRRLVFTGVAGACTRNNTCPKFNYNMQIPEFKAVADQWFTTNNVDYFAGVTNDLTVKVGLLGQSLTNGYLHEATAGSGGNGSLPTVYFPKAYGYLENTAQTLEYYPNSATNYSHFLLGGEAVETYYASTSAPVKTRTVSYPIGVLSNDFNRSTGTAYVYFPENGIATGTVSVKKAWVRLLSNYYVGGTTRNIQITTKVGTNGAVGPAQYNFNAPLTTQKSSLQIIHVLPQADYASLESANGVSSTTVAVAALGSANTVGGTSAELLITYTYTGEANGRLSSLDIFGGQSTLDGSVKLSSSTGLTLILPEYVTSKQILAGGLLTSYLISSKSGVLSNANILLDSNLSTSTVPTCTNVYVAHTDNGPLGNDFTEFYKNVFSSLDTPNRQLFNVCQSNNLAANANEGAKMNSKLIYTYRFNPPVSQFSQNNWQWYQNIDALNPTASSGPEKASTTNINIGDVLRLRINLQITDENLATTSQLFKLQYGVGVNCNAIASTSWFDLGTSTSATIWRSYDNLSVVNGSSSGTTLLSDSNIFETYEEDNPSALNPFYVAEQDKGEWDWVINNNGASSTQSYCFRMIEGDGTVFKNYGTYPQLLTAASNTPPINPSGLSQWKNSTTSAIANGDWINESAVRLVASTTDVNINSTLRLFFQVATSASFITATTVPASCPLGTTWTLCANKIWSATSSLGNYRFNPFGTTSQITALPDNYSTTTSYKWQSLACDNYNVCSGWTAFATAPNFRVDTVAPTSTGPLTLALASTTSLVLKFGTSATEANFSQYIIYYKKGTSSTVVTENDTSFSSSSDINLSKQNFNGATTTVINSLSSGESYVFNIWAYDLAGNRASSSIKLVASTSNSSMSPPTGSLSTVGQVTDGSGNVSLGFLADDPDNDDTLRAKIMYIAGSSCALATSSAYIDPADASTVANYGDPKVDNNLAYQIGSSTGWILTSPGANGISTVWLSKNNLANTEGWYCIRLIVNDGVTAGNHDQLVPSDYTVYVDNINPTNPGNLTQGYTDTQSMTLAYGSASFDTHFSKYRLFYSTTSPVVETDNEWIDGNLLTSNFNSATSTVITGLQASTTYYIKMWVYDTYGNEASTSILTVTTDKIPSAASIYGQYMSNGSTVIANGNWTTENQVKLSFGATDPDTTDTLSFYTQLVGSSSSFIIATSVPANACLPDVVQPNCTSTVWLLATSTTGNYSIVPFNATSTIAGLNESATGYKWQVLACDSKNACSNTWTKFNLSAPNFKVDTIAPTAPGDMSYNSKTSVTVTLNLGSSSSETNFNKYVIYYGTSSIVTESNASSTSTDLSSLNYGGLSMYTVDSLDASTTYYFSIYAYDLAGNKASSSVVSVSTNQVKSTPGVMFYAKASTTLYYRRWENNAWGAEKVGPNMGSTTIRLEGIRHIITQVSDDHGKVAVMVKSATTSTAFQEWWGTVYRFSADDFVNTKQLGTAWANATANTQIGGCLAAFSGGEFLALRASSTASIEAYTWSTAGGWVYRGVNLAPANRMDGGCNLIRRPGTNNYLLIEHDIRTGSGISTSYYYGTSTTYVPGNWNGLTSRTQYEYSANVLVADGFFDPGDNTRAVFYGSSTVSSTTLSAWRVNVTDGGVSSYSATATSPTGADAWPSRVAQGVFAANPGATGIGYFAGRDTGAVNTLNVYRLDITNPTPIWSTTTNGKYVNTPNSLYAITNLSQKPFDLDFYKNDYGLVTWGISTLSLPRYKKLNALSNSLDSASSSVPNASSSVWLRSRLYKDPNDIQLLAIYQDNQKSYASIFWDGSSNQFITSGSQAWKLMATTTGAQNANDALTDFSYTAGNSNPNTPSGLAQYMANGTTTIANGDWITQSTAVLRLAATDPDTLETLGLYLQLVDNSVAFSATSTPPVSPCASTTAFTGCSDKIWFIASSTPGDYSQIPFVATATITNIQPDSTSTSGYKWQVLACDTAGTCSNWAPFNNSQPNFRVDVTKPTNPAIAFAGKTANSITLQLVATSTETNFVRYQIYYSTTSPVLQTSASSSDPNLTDINFNGATSTMISNLSSSTLYYFRIWVYDLAGNIGSSTTEISTTTNALASIYQTSYIFQNDDGLTVNSNSTSTLASTTLASVIRGERLILRLQLDNRGGDPMTNKSYVLQYKNLIDGTDMINNWYNVGALDSSRGIFNINTSLGLSGNSGDTLTASTTASSTRTWVNGIWYENTATSSFSLVNGYYTEVAYMLNTATTSKLSNTYRFRLYNSTDGKVLDGYNNFPHVTIVATDTIRYTKASQSVLPSGNYDLTYYLDHKGYANVLTNDGVYDSATTSNAIPVYNFVTYAATNTKAITCIWDGQSTVAASVNSLHLQIYRFGTTNTWQEVASNATTSANSDVTLTGSLINAKLSEYYDSNNAVYCRVYQNSGTQALRTDYATTTFSAPSPTVYQLHYRWRNDDGNELTASWMNPASPEDTATATLKWQKVRLRMSVANLTAGSAANYRYRLEYATSSIGDCSVDPGGWSAVPTNNSLAFQIATSSYFADQTLTTATTTNAEGYSFVAGRMVGSTTVNMTASTTLAEQQYTENEFAVMATNNAVDGSTYCFRLTNNGATFGSSNYNNFGELTLINNNAVALPVFISTTTDASDFNSPTNYGAPVTFNAIGSTTDDSDYYLAVCKTSAIMAGNNAPPTCPGGNWCISTVASSNVPVNCDYVTATTSEVLNWYSYICERKSGSGNAKCSLQVNDGNADPADDSPFVINHQPVLTNITTVVTNSVPIAGSGPGSTYSFNSIATDTDVMSGLSTLTYLICNTNSATYAGCASTTLCSVVGTTTANPACSFTTPVPSASGNIHYYGFLFDNRNLGAINNGLDRTYSIWNVPPTIGSVIFNNGLDITLNMAGATDTQAVVRAPSVVDVNGCNDLSSASSKVFLSSVAGGISCTANSGTYSNCYAPPACSITGCTVGGTTAVVTCTSTLKYYAIPTDGTGANGNPNWPANWLGSIQVNDNGGNFPFATSSGVEIIASQALNVNESAINFGGTLTPGQNTGTTTQPTTIVNAGNSPIDTNIAGTDMTANPSGTILADFLHYLVGSSTFSWTNGTHLTNGGVTEPVAIPRATSSTDSAKKVYWGIGIPFGVPSYSYSGINTFTSIPSLVNW